jgi:hypothetical protein
MRSFDQSPFNQVYTERFRLSTFRYYPHIQEEIISRAGLKQIRIFLERAHSGTG